MDEPKTLKAGNTTATLEPRPIEFTEPKPLVVKPLEPKEEVVYSPKTPDKPAPNYINFITPEGNVKSAKPDFDYKDTGIRNPLEVRVKKLEEQLDALLDRVAKFNIRSQHHI